MEKDLSDAAIVAALKYMNDYVTSRIHEKVWSIESHLRAKDLRFKHRVADLQFVTPEQFGVEKKRFVIESMW